ncbi:MAG: 4Fe-4S binding protein [Tissierellia bacterium]|nr:4Fe-4S binding protein [Tissierellia bacterium]
MAKGRVFFEQDLCKGCNLCVSVCPTKILAIDETKLNAKGYHPAYVENPDNCIACAFCGLVCPDLVITVEKFDKQKEV